MYIWGLKELQEMKLNTSLAKCTSLIAVLQIMKFPKRTSFTHKLSSVTLSLFAYFLVFFHSSVSSFTISPFYFFLFFSSILAPFLASYRFPFSIISFSFPSFFIYLCPTPFHYFIYLHIYGDFVYFFLQSFYRLMS